MNDTTDIARIIRPANTAAVRLQFIRARTCYGHLAGEVAVKVLAAMLQARWLAAKGRDFEITALGQQQLAALGVDVAGALRSRRLHARACLDLTQRRPHLSGALGDALLDCFVARGWVQRQPRSRAVRITRKGQAGFRRGFGI